MNWIHDSGLDCVRTAGSVMTAPLEFRIVHRTTKRDSFPIYIFVLERCVVDVEVKFGNCPFRPVAYTQFCCVLKKNRFSFFFSSRATFWVIFSKMLGEGGQCFGYIFRNARSRRSACWFDFFEIFTVKTLNASGRYFSKMLGQGDKRFESPSLLSALSFQPSAFSSMRYRTMRLIATRPGSYNGLRAETRQP